MQTTTANAGLTDIVDILREQKARQVDVVAPSTAILSRDASLVLTGTETVLSEDGVTVTDGTYRPTTVCDEGLAGKLGVPVQYLRRMREDRPDLFDANVNGWLHGRRAKVRYGQPTALGITPDQVIREATPADPRKFLVRCFRGDDTAPGIARAFLSDSYKPIDHLDGLLATLDGITAAGVDARVHSADLTDRRMVVRVVCEDVKGYARTLLKGYRSPFTGASGDENPTVFAGFKITNSETGGGAYQIVPELRVQVCDNGMTITKDALRAVHLGSRLEEGIIKWGADTQRKQLDLVKAQTRDAVRTFLDVDYVTRQIEKLEGRAAQVLDSAEEVTALTKPLGYTRDQQDSILSHFIRGGQMTRGGVFNAITAAAQEHDPDARYDMEAVAVRVLV